METFDHNLKLTIPEMFLFAWALFVIVFDIGSKRRNSDSVGYLTMAGLAITAVLLYNFHGGVSFNNMFTSDVLALFFKVIGHVAHAGVVARAQVRLEGIGG